MTMNETTSCTDVYMDGITVPANPDEMDYTTDLDFEAISWDAPDCPAEALQAQAEIATELHCLHMSLLNTLGTIISDTSDMDTKRLATALSSAHMRNADAWGWYMKQASRHTHVSDEITEHLDGIAAGSTCCQLAAAALSGTLAAAMHRHLDTENTVFGQILHREAVQGTKNIELIEQYLKQQMETVSTEEQHKVFARIEECISWLDQYVDTYRDALDAANIDGDAVAEDFQTAAHRLYKRISPGMEPVEERVVHVRDRAQ